MNEETKRLIENHNRQRDEVAEAEAQAVEAAALALIAQTEIEDGSHQARTEAQQNGWAVETTDGERVLVARKTSTAAGDILEDADGNKYIARPSGATVEPIEP